MQMCPKIAKIDQEKNGKPEPVVLDGLWGKKSIPEIE
jgi:hypothetical protein